MHYELIFCNETEKRKFISTAEKKLAENAMTHAQLAEITGYSNVVVDRFFKCQVDSRFLAAAIADVLEIGEEE